MTPPNGAGILVVNPGADVYGSDLQLLESVTAMIDGGSQVMVACPEQGPLLPLLVDRGCDVRVVDFPVLRRSYLSARGIMSLAVELARTLPAMWRLIGDVDPEAIYVNTTTIPWWIFLARLRRVPVVCHVHEAEDTAGSLAGRLLNAPLLTADRLILISETAASSVWQVFPRLRRKSVIVMNGVPDRTDLPTPYSTNHGALRLAVVGRLSPRKAPHVAIQALKVLVDRGVDATLEVAGSVFPGYEWYEEQLRSDAARLEVAERVSFTGYVWPSHVAFDRTDIVIAPSVREPFGNVVVEAQLSARPVIAAAYGGHLESIEDGVTGILVPPEDPEAVALAVERLLADPVTAADIARKARGSALRQFGIPRYQMGIRQVLTETVQR
ncbi:glycosyltransferase family 4 protein [Phycicoccus sp. Root101]|uniref:glycosyltransferase family 4 protein n=1 Tax=Phycicoccus sp. Root101 TaxID=1736421 RepID=UPI000703BC36|nr:glycosyltransferase family 4 protein [Phycicoccus sp. Root101]KQU67658.1 hypothetical protein ASC58_14145 [Phycicoccus sp. Root101]